MFSVPSLLSLPSFQETPRCFQKEPHVPQLSSLLSLSLGSSLPFPISFLHYLPSRSVDVQNPGNSIRAATRQEKMKEQCSSKGNSAGGFSCLHQHLPPTPPIHGSVLPACHPFPSILLQTQQWIICFLSLRHCQCVTCRAGSNSSLSSLWLVVSPSLCATANTRHPRLRSVSFIFHSVF